MIKQTNSLSPKDYVHLHNHTQYSLLDGLTKIGPLIDFVKDNQMEAIAKTDHGTLAGTIEFYKEALAKEIKPIIGLETYVATRKYTDKDVKKDKSRFHLVLLATNMTGYQNLLKLSTLANLDGFYYQPRVDRDLLQKYNEGLIAMSACLGGEIGRAIKEDDIKKAETVALWYKNVFKDRFYLEVQDHGHPNNPLPSKEQEKANNKIIKIGQKLDIPIVVTCDAHYLKREDQDAHEILLCVGTGSYLSDQKRMTLKDYPLHVEDPKEIIKRWGADYPEFITNTKKIADSCHLNIKLDKILIPKFSVPNGETEKTYFDKLVYRGLAYRYGNIPKDEASTFNVTEAKKTLPKEILNRAEYELGVIDSMGFSGYFLIIWDFIKWGKDKGIVFGPGRGSAAGSIVSYALNITELDPLQYDLLFERFLNPDRISMPDIDIDIQDSRRDEVIQYCINKYGKDKVANIVTYGRMAARAAIRDVGRVLQVPLSDVDRLAKMIPPPVQGRHTPLSVTIKQNKELKDEYDNNPISKQIIDMAVQLEGTLRSLGVHAAGVVIAPDDIVKFVPLVKAQKGVITTQYTMGPIEDLGLLKMDFLGLSNLTIIKNALRIIKKVYKEDIDIDKLPLDDKKTYKLLGKGDTTGVFQLESAGMKRYLKELKPTEFEDIIAMVALYRPGPMQFIDDFIARKHGKKSITYMHPKMEDALKNTYGVLVYQEQVMQLSKDLCGFSGGQSDTLRKGIAKKIPEVLDKMKVEFIEGAVNHSNADKKDMEKFWKQLEDFAAYCFNKSHAACYAMIAYWTAYLKAHFPDAYMAALMTSDFDNIDRLAIEINECKHMGIQVLPPDVNQSYGEFAIVPHKNNETLQIRFGLDAIKNVGQGAVQEIIKVREDEGSFTSLVDFISKVDGRLVNRKIWESLTKSGAFDNFTDRAALLENLDYVLATGSKINKDKKNGQTDLFGDDKGEKFGMISNIEIPQSSNLYTENDYLQWERELLGLYLSKHPLESYGEIFIEKAVPLEKITPQKDGKSVQVGGIISSIRQITTRTGLPMAFVKLEDIYGSEMELVVFPNVFKKDPDIWQSQKMILADGRINGKDKGGNEMPEAKIIVESAVIVELEEAEKFKTTGTKKHIAKTKIKPKIAKSSNNQKRLYIRMPDTSNDKLLSDLKDILEANSGTLDAVLVLGESKQILKLPQKVDFSQDLLDSLKTLLGQENVKFN